MTIAACARYWPTCAPDLPTDAKADATRRRMTFVPLPVLQVDNEPRVRDGYISLDTRGHARTLKTQREVSVCRENVIASARPCTPVPPQNLHGKEGVDGSSPSEGLTKVSAQRSLSCQK